MATTTFCRRYTVCIGFLFILSFLPVHGVQAQKQSYVAIIPALHDRLNTSGFESPLHLQSQKFTLFVYPDGVAVSSEALFVNTGLEAVTQEFSLPSTGHDENGALPGGRRSSGILSAQLWVEGIRILPEFINDGSEDWYTIHNKFEPGEHRKINSLFWVQTSLDDGDAPTRPDTVVINEGDRGFVVDLAHAAIWSGEIESLKITVVLMDGIDAHDRSFDATPKAYEIVDSTLTWQMHDVEPALTDNISVFYSSDGNQSRANNTMEKLKIFFVDSVYDDLLDYVSDHDDE